jgi:membrane associated rhomboid family serine protease
MIPIRDHNPHNIFPFVNYLLIGLNIVVWLFQITLGPLENQFIYTFGIIPYEITHHLDTVPLSPFPVYANIIFSMFLHGGLAHLFGNMLYLWIFGDNIEALLGHGRYLIFYLVCGLAAAFTQIFFNSQSMVPMIGASGAISGVLGAYLLRFPRAQVSVLFWIFIFIRVVKVPALFVLGFWFLMQLTSGFAAVGLGYASGGVAWFAHIGGFICGFSLIRLFELRHTRVWY